MTEGALIGEAYLRKSRAMGDPDDPRLLEHHRAALIRLAASDGVHLPPENIIEEIGSGDTIAGRPKFAAKVQEWERGIARAQVFYVTEPERLSRGSLMEIGRVAEAMRGVGVKLRTLSRWFDLEQADDEFFYALVGALGRRENAKYKERARVKLTDMRANGEVCNGRVPFGYRWTKKKKLEPKLPEPDPDKFPVLKALLSDAFHYSTAQLAEQYDLKEHIVARAIHSPIVCGWPARRHVPIPNTKYCRRLPFDQWQWPEKPGDYEAAISRPEFERLQVALLSRHRGQNRPFSPEGWCRDVVNFHGAPTGVPVCLGVWRNPTKWYFTYQVPTQNGELKLYINREAVHSAAEAAVRRAIGDPVLLGQILTWASEMEAEEAAAASGDNDLASLNREIAARRSQLDKLLRLELEADSAERRQSLARAGKQIEAEIAGLQARIQAQSSRAPLNPELRAVLTHLEEDAKVLPDRVWETAVRDGQRRTFVKAFIAGIDVVVEKGRSNRTYRREVVGVRYRPEIQLYLDTS